MSSRQERTFFIRDTLRRAPWMSAAAGAVGVAGIGLAVSIGLEAPSESTPAQDRVVRAIQEHPFGGPPKEAPLEEADAFPLGKTFGSLACLGGAAALSAVACRRADQARGDALERSFYMRLRRDVAWGQGPPDVVPPQYPHPPEYPGLAGS